MGYVWLAAAALWFGVPDPTPGTSLDEVIEAIRPIGVALALSFFAFLLGSVTDDVSGRSH